MILFLTYSVSVKFPSSFSQQLVHKRRNILIFVLNDFSKHNFWTPYVGGGGGGGEVRGYTAYKKRNPTSTYHYALITGCMNVTFS